MATPSKRRLSPYGSARDLPSYQEMARQIQGGKLLTRFIARNQRSGLLEVERQLNHLVAVVDRFYDRLGSRNWIFHEFLPVSNVEAILDQTATSEEAEQRLIEIYRDEDKLTFWTRRLYSVEGLRERSHQIERARGHYCADHFDSAAFHLIAVMDGLVNDFEPDRRHGLASRDPDAMTAWDSVVGHHLGLTNALKAYDKTIKKRIDEEVYELHRHGIVHGTVTRFDNVVVATQDMDTRMRLARGIAKNETRASVEVFSALKRRGHPGRVLLPPCPMAGVVSTRRWWRCMGRYLPIRGGGVPPPGNVLTPPGNIFRW